ncbi:MAG: AraC family transcriptional regulator [Opitutaceae bacterium]|jgi:AraC-like DNA-binding protein|nr:AraC family transcriptional regulator [Opitutaceae bacterium]
MSRLGLILSGRHDIAFVRKSVTIEAHMQPGDLWFFPVDTHDDELFRYPCRYISAVFFEGYTRVVMVEGSGPGDIYPAPFWFHWHEERPVEIASLLQTLLSVNHRESANQTGVHLCRALWLLLIEWLQSIDKKEVPPRSKATATWMAVDRMINDNYHRPINRQTVADSLQLHPNRISELCREFGGDTFQHILERRRLRQAKRFLESSRTKIEAIAIMCGFSGVTYFTRAFGRATGMSPGEWRRHHEARR